MPISLIVAAAGKKQVIGKDGDLPWHFSADLKFFKAKTMGHPVVMGRITYESIVKRLGKPLPGRDNFVMTRDPAFSDARVHILRDKQEIQRLAETGQEVFVIGGASVYRELMGLADKIFLTYIDRETDGDAHFPAIDPDSWAMREELSLLEHDTPLHFRTYTRRTT